MVSARLVANGCRHRGSGSGIGRAPPPSDTLRGCPRALLSALLAGAAKTLVPETLAPETPVPKTLGPETLAPETLGPSTGDAVSALAIEREILGLCRERQEIVTGIVRAEGELRALLAESRGGTAAPPAAADTPIVKVSTPVRVVSLTAHAGWRARRGAGKGGEAGGALLVLVLDHRHCR